MTFPFASFCHKDRLFTLSDLNRAEFISECIYRNTGAMRWVRTNCDIRHVASAPYPSCEIPLVDDKCRNKYLGITLQQWVSIGLPCPITEVISVLDRYGWRFIATTDRELAGGWLVVVPQDPAVHNLYHWLGWEEQEYFVQVAVNIYNIECVCVMTTCGEALM